jgi:hypothetical protein
MRSNADAACGLSIGENCFARSERRLAMFLGGGIDECAIRLWQNACKVERGCVKNRSAKFN